MYQRFMKKLSILGKINDEISLLQLVEIPRYDVTPAIETETELTCSNLKNSFCIALESLVYNSNAGEQFVTTLRGNCRESRELQSSYQPSNALFQFLKKYKYDLHS